ELRVDGAGREARGADRAGADGLELVGGRCTELGAGRDIRGGLAAARSPRTGPRLRGGSIGRWPLRGITEAGRRGGWTPVARRVVVDRRPVGPVGAMRTMPPPVRVTPTVIAVGIAVAIGVAVAIPVTDVQATPPAAGIAVDTAVGRAVAIIVVIDRRTPVVVI